MRITRHPDGRVLSTPLHLAGIGLQFFGAGMAISAIVDLIVDAEDFGPLAISAVVLASLGTIARTNTAVPGRVSARSAFAAVGWTWVICAVAGALPFWLAGLLTGNETFETWDGALFEAVSGFSATGSSVITDFDSIGAGLMFWRQMSQWFGGMGIVVLAVAVLPLLGVGGMELMTSEAPGPTSDRLVPRVSETARRLWMIYLAFTVLVTLSLLALGLSLFDAVTHAFTTVSTGGFSPNALSIGEYDSTAVEAVVSFWMIVCGINFALHWSALAGRDPRVIFRDAGVRFYLFVLVAGTLFVATVLIIDGLAVGTALRDAVFNVASLGTSTGFGNLRPEGGANFVLWPPAAQLALFYLMFTGAMVGSTSGGLKLLRIRIASQVVIRQLQKVRQPRSVPLVKLGGSPIPEDIVSRVIGFVLLYLGISALGTLIMSWLGIGLIEAVSGAVQSMGNMGPGLGEIGPAEGFAGVPRPARAVMMALMIIGRLEIFAILLMFSAMRLSLRRHGQSDTGARLEPLIRHRRNT
ncbi:MAG: TrkH family potassium uptake protein [Actinomycetia bacterium]|nr:TrkH family potassium uptake protein [Actinomycetes bacterium]